MPITAVNIQNLTANALSLDIMIEPDRQIRRLLQPQQTIDVSDICTIDELNRTQTLQSLIAAGSVAVSVVPQSPDTDLPGTPVEPILAGQTGYPRLGFITGIIDVSNIPENKAITGTNLTQGQTAASAVFGTGTSSVTVVALRPGEPGNLIALNFVDSAAASVAVSGGAVVGERTVPTIITVNYRGPLNGNADNANAVAALINADVTAGAAWLVQATGGGTGNFTATSGNLSGGVGEGFKVYVGNAEMNVNDPITDTALPMTTRTDAGSGIVAANYVGMYVVSNGVASNTISSAVQA